MATWKMWLITFGFRRSIFKDRSTCYFIRIRVDFGGRLVLRLIVELIVDRLSIALLLIEAEVDRLGFDICV
jgi:hypothetical protein